MRKTIIYSIGCLAMSAVIQLATQPKHEVEVPRITPIEPSSFAEVLERRLPMEVTPEVVLEELMDAETIGIEFSKCVNIGDTLTELLHVSSQYDYRTSKGHVVCITESGDNDVWYQEDEYYYYASPSGWCYANTDESLTLCQTDAYRLTKNINTIQYILKCLSESEDVCITRLDDFITYSVTVDKPATNGELLKSDVTADTCSTYIQLRVPKDSEEAYVCSIQTFYTNSDVSLNREVYEYVFVFNKDFQLNVF